MVTPAVSAISCTPTASYPLAWKSSSAQFRIFSLLSIVPSCCLNCPSSPSCCLNYTVRYIKCQLERLCISPQILLSFIPDLLFSSFFFFFLFYTVRYITSALFLFSGYRNCSELLPDIKKLPAIFSMADSFSQSRMLLQAEAAASDLFIFQNIPRSVSGAYV